MLQHTNSDLAEQAERQEQCLVTGHSSLKLNFITQSLVVLTKIGEHLPFLQYDFLSMLQAKIIYLSLPFLSFSGYHKHPNIS